jgi:hypothetical protein
MAQLIDDRHSASEQSAWVVESRGDRWKIEARWGIELLPLALAGEMKVACTTFAHLQDRGNRGGWRLAAGGCGRW